ncbi:MAG: sugar ABC transporter substrate-binding protein [Proteobacteria bacterium]|nr:MAG: sugar ABC transporter substrate-binding protein [Pseudomonadota bacterium]
MKVLTTSTLFSTIMALLTSVLLVGCASNSSDRLTQATIKEPVTKDSDSYRYLVGPGDELDVFVWGNREVSGSFTVRPDGMITTSLVEDIEVAGATPAEIARRIEEKLSIYIRDPIVSVSVTSFAGPFSEQVRVIGEAAKPRALSYTEHMTLLDVLIKVKGLTDFAAGNRASLLRIENGEYKNYSLRLEDLIEEGDITANIDILPGDIIVIPEAWF